MNAADIQKKLKALANPKDAQVFQWFFKTGPGEYGEGDVFIGVRVPAVRKLAKECQAANHKVLLSLLASPIHEDRALALFILVRQFEAGSPGARSQVYRIYRAHTKSINNWDLVDLSAPAIVGGYFLQRSRRPLLKLARSHSLWERRISILATLAFIRRNEFEETLAIADLLLHDRHDLIHKAVGWMLREVGKRDQKRLEAFLIPRYGKMPRTMLRYAIERFPESLRQHYLLRLSESAKSAALSRSLRATV